MRRELVRIKGVLSAVFVVLGHAIHHLPVNANDGEPLPRAIHFHGFTLGESSQKSLIYAIVVFCGF